MNQKHQTSIVYLSQITVYPNQMSVHYRCNLKNSEGFYVTRDTGKSEVNCFSQLSPSQCVSKPNVGALSVTLRLTGNFFYCQCGKRRFSHFMSDSCQTPWQIMHVLTFLFKMRVLENAGKLMNHGITRYSYMGRDSSVLLQFIEERQLQPERYICEVT